MTRCLGVEGGVFSFSREVYEMQNQLWYMSSFRKASQDGESIAQVQLSQGQEGWILEWISSENGELTRERWYAGWSWEELQLCCRCQTAGKQAAGYEPLIEGLEMDWMIDGRAMFSQMLYYYAESRLKESEPLFEKLREWRKELALKEQVPPFIIASNRLLGMISVFKPQTLEELKQLPGVGRQKLEKYGKTWLQMLQGEKQPGSFPLDWVAAEIDAQAFRRWYFQNKEKQYKQEWEEVQLRKQMLQGLEQMTPLNELAEQTGKTRRELLEWIERLDQEGYDAAAWTERELQDMPGETISQSFKWFAELGDRYLKPVMQKVYGEPEPDQLESIYEKLRLMRILYRKERRQAAV